MSFTEGNVHNGVSAKLYTNNVFKQKAIEASALYKSGQVILERSIKEASDEEPQPITQKVAQNTTTAMPLPEGKGESKDGGVLDFANVGEAILYVANHFGVAAQTASEVRKVLAEHGLKAVIHK